MSHTGKRTYNYRRAGNNERRQIHKGIEDGQSNEMLEYSCGILQRIVYSRSSKLYIVEPWMLINGVVVGKLNIPATGKSSGYVFF